MNQLKTWYYEPGIFPTQQKFCKAVEWTYCNLEGQKIKSLNHLSAKQGNPLTIRLRSLDEAIKHFNNFKRIERKIKALSREQIDNNRFSVMSGKWEAENSSLNTMGAPIEVIEIKGERFELKYIDIQLALYEFFTNIGSILDRLTYEINLLYDLGIIQRYILWSTLTNMNGKYFTMLKKKDEDLTTLLANYATKLEMATRYRNRLVHDGIIKVEVDIRIIKSVIALAENPEDDKSPMNVDPIRFCENTRIELLHLLEKSYEIMFQHFRTCGNPPW